MQGRLTIFERRSILHISSLRVGANEKEYEGYSEEEGSKSMDKVVAIWRIVKVGLDALGRRKNQAVGICHD